MNDAQKKDLALWLGYGFIEHNFIYKKTPLETGEWATTSFNGWPENDPKALKIIKEMYGTI